MDSIYVPSEKGLYHLLDCTKKSLKSGFTPIYPDVPNLNFECLLKSLLRQSRGGKAENTDFVFWKAISKKVSRLLKKVLVGLLRRQAFAWPAACLAITGLYLFLI